MLRRLGTVAVTDEDSVRTQAVAETINGVKMPKSVPLSDVKLSYDKAGLIRLSSKDPKFQGQAFTASFAPGTRNYELAAAVLRSEGVDIPTGANLPEKASWVLSSDPELVNVGVDATGKTKALEIPHARKNLPPSILVLAKDPAERTNMIATLVKHFEGHPEDFSVHYVKTEDLDAEDFSHVSGIRPVKGRQVLFVGEHSGSERAVSRISKILRESRSHNQVVVLSASDLFEVDRNFSLNVFTSWLVVGKQEFRARVLSRTDKLPAQKPFEGVVTGFGLTPTEKNRFRSFSL